MYQSVNFIQVDCYESNSLDFRQAKAILKYKPDIVLFEYPNNTDIFDMSINHYPATSKPRELIDKLFPIDNQTLKTHPWAQADKKVWSNIEKLWQENHQVLVYRIDAPNELTEEKLREWRSQYPKIKNNWLWWVRIYLREKYMAKYLQEIMANYKQKQDPTVLVFLQSFHWEHVKFLMENHTPDEIWKYYFSQFSEIDQNSIKEKIKKLNSVFYKYWLKISDFV